VFAACAEWCSCQHKRASQKCGEFARPLERKTCHSAAPTNRKQNVTLMRKDNSFWFVQIRWTRWYSWAPLSRRAGQAQDDDHSYDRSETGTRLVMAHFAGGTTSRFLQGILPIPGYFRRPALITASDNGRGNKRFLARRRTPVVAHRGRWHPHVLIFRNGLGTTSSVVVSQYVSPIWRNAESGQRRSGGRQHSAGLGFECCANSGRNFEEFRLPFRFERRPVSPRQNKYG